MTDKPTEQPKNEQPVTQLQDEYAKSLAEYNKKLAKYNSLAPDQQRYAYNDLVKGYNKTAIVYNSTTEALGQQYSERYPEPNLNYKYQEQPETPDIKEPAKNWRP